ncbi:MAG: septum site-determining protein MinD [Clostridia bacterium]|nr:septum site-determining protein MinD [Clostridia bacterium]
MARKIVITSGKGGVGKTTICANLGIRLASTGLRVVMMDLDIGLNNLDVVMGIENKVVYDIVDVIDGKCRAKQALIQDMRQPSLYTMPSAHIYTENKITGYGIKYVVDQLAQSFDYVLLDCPAGIDSGFHRAVFSASEAIVITTPHIASIRDADKVISILNSYQLNKISFIVNRIRGDLVLNGQMIDVKNIENLLKVQLVGVIPEDDEISTCSSLGGGVHSKTESYLAFKNLCDNLHNGTDNMFDYTLKYKGFLGSIKRNLRKRV